MKSNVQLRMNADTVLKLRAAYLPSYCLISVSDVQKPQK